MGVSIMENNNNYLELEDFSDEIMNPGEQIEVAKRAALRIPNNVYSKIAGELFSANKPLLKPFEKSGSILTGKTSKQYAMELKELLSNPFSLFNMPVTMVLQGAVSVIDRFSNMVHSKESYIETIVSNEKMFASLNMKKAVNFRKDVVNDVRYVDTMDIYGTKIVQPRNLGYVVTGQNGESGQGVINLEFSWVTEDGLAWTEVLDVTPKSKDWSIAVFPATSVENFNTVLIGITSPPYESSQPGHNHHIVAIGVNSDTSIGVMPIQASGVKQMFDILKKSV